MLDIYRINKEIRIPRSDWINQFQKYFYKGEFVLVEIPYELSETLDKLKNVEQRELAERLLATSKTIRIAESSLRDGEWRTAISQLRDAIEPISKGIIEINGNQISIKKAIKDLIAESGLPDKVGDSVTQMIDRLFQYASATHHIIDKGKEINLEPPFEKEDAYFVFSTTTFLLNILAQKLIKQTTPSIP